MNGFVLAGIGISLMCLAESMGYALANHLPLSTWGNACFLFAVLLWLTQLPWRRIAVMVIASILRNAPRAQAAGAATVPHMQTAGQAVGHGAQNLRQKATAGVRKLYRAALDNYWLTLGVILMLYAATLLYSQGPSVKAFLVFLAGVGCVVLHYSLLRYGARRVRQSIVASAGWAIRRLGKAIMWVGTKLAEGLVWVLTKLLTFWLQVLSGKFGKEAAYFGWFFTTLILGLLFASVASLQNATLALGGFTVSVAYALLAAAFFLAIATALLFVKKDLVK